MRYFVFAVIALILASLGSALYYMIRDKGQSTRTVRMLALRVAFSIFLFLVLMLGYKLGFIQGKL
jgi:formate/nitrite transporter FocA (FNT family)